jgi:hypothetical protein
LETGNYDMELIYLTSDGKEISWSVEEVVREQSYRIVDVNGRPNPQRVDHTEGGSRSIIFFDGFILEGNKVYATALLTRTPKIEVGHSPNTA